MVCVKDERLFFTPLRTIITTEQRSYDWPAMEKVVKTQLCSKIRTGTGRTEGRKREREEIGKPYHNITISLWPKIEKNNTKTITLCQRTSRENYASG